MSINQENGLVLLQEEPRRASWQHSLRFSPQPDRDPGSALTRCLKPALAILQAAPTPPSLFLLASSRRPRFEIRRCSTSTDRHQFHRGSEVGRTARWGDVWP
eukprot:evm.model.scf_355.6 EVM.evm.TU.scf_355.6   scf_355:67725-68030(-)